MDTRPSNKSFNLSQKVISSSNRKSSSNQAIEPTLNILIGSESNPTVVSDDEELEISTRDPDDSSYTPSERTDSPRPAMNMKQASKKLQDMNRSELYEELKRVKKRRAEENKERKAAKKQRVNLQKEVTRLMANQHRWEEEKLQLKSEYDADLLIQTEKFDKARKAMQKLLKNEKSTTLPDDVVKEHFSKLASSCKSWVHAWCSPKLDFKNKPVLKDILSRCINDHSPSHLEEVFQELTKRETLAAKVLLNADISDRVFQIFKSPFFLFESWDSSPEIFERCFEETHQVFKKVNSWEAHRWRAATLRILDLALSSEKIGKEVLDSKTSDRKCWEESRKAVFELESILLRSPISTDEQNYRIDQLCDIFKQSRKLARQLHAKEEQICVPKGSNILNEPFQINSEIYDSYPSMGLDSNDHRYDGRQISLVVTPMIKAVAHMESNKKKVRKVWLKAVVLILEDEKIEKETNSKFQIMNNPDQYQNDLEDGNSSSEGQTSYGSRAALNESADSPFNEPTSPTSSVQSSNGYHNSQCKPETMNNAQENYQIKAKWLP